MNDSNLCYKKFMANYGYLLYNFKKVSVFELTILTISVVLNVWKLDFS